MTYCVALRLNRGLVFAADTRTNAGVDNIAQFRKIHYWCERGDRVIVLLAAGNLSLTQSVVSVLNEQLLDADPEKPNLLNVQSMYRAARLVGDAVRSVRSFDGPALDLAKTSFAGSFILGGQIKTEPPRLFQIYPRATSSRQPTTRRISRSASTSTANRFSTAWPSPPCAWAKRQS